MKQVLDSCVPLGISHDFLGLRRPHPENEGFGPNITKGNFLLCCELKCVIHTNCSKSQEWGILVCWESWEGPGEGGGTCNGMEDKEDLAIEGDKRRERDKWKNSSDRLRVLDQRILEDWKY